MKILLTFFVLFFSSNLYSKDMVNPITFKGSEKEKKEVIAYIEFNMNQIYCSEIMKSMNTCTNSTLRMMEDEELLSFKKLILANEISILKDVINTYCSEIMKSMNACTYATILMMYEEEVSAAGQKLDW